MYFCINAPLYQTYSMFKRNGKCGVLSLSLSAAAERKRALAVLLKGEY